MDEQIKQLQEKQEEARIGGGQARIDAQHAKNKLTARERIHFLLDEGSFEEIGMMVKHRSQDFGLDKKTSNVEKLRQVEAMRISSPRYVVDWNAVASFGAAIRGRSG